MTQRAHLWWKHSKYHHVLSQTTLSHRAQWKHVRLLNKDNLQHYSYHQKQYKLLPKIECFSASYPSTKTKEAVQLSGYYMTLKE